MVSGQIRIKCMIDEIISSLERQLCFVRFSLSQWSSNSSIRSVSMSRFPFEKIWYVNLKENCIGSDHFLLIADDNSRKNTMEIHIIVLALRFHDICLVLNFKPIIHMQIE